MPRELKKSNFLDLKCPIQYFETSRVVRETHISNLVSFYAKTTKLWLFYGSRLKDEITENTNREKDKRRDGAYPKGQLILYR